MPSLDQAPSPAPLQPPEGDYASFRYGGAYYPLRPDDGRPLPDWNQYGATLRDVDPARFYACDFFAWGLDYFLGQRLRVEAERAGVGLAQAVASLALVDPEPFVAGGAISEYRFPLLCVTRKRSLAKYVSKVWAYRESTWLARYVLPPMGATAASKLEPFLRGVEAVLDWCAEVGMHPAYAPPGGQLGEQAWDEDRAGLQEINTGDSAWGWLQESAGADVYLSIDVNLVVKERRMPLRAGDAGSPSKLAGIDATEDLASTVDQALKSVVRARRDF